MQCFAVNTLIDKSQEPNFRAAIYKIEIKEGERILRVGTAFAIKKNWLLTAFHNIGDCPAILDHECKQVAV